MPVVMKTQEETAGERRDGWFVVHTKRHKERATGVRLEQEGLEAYVPLLFQWPRPAVGSAVGPMFPCYVFVRAGTPRDFHRIGRTPGVHGIVRFGGTPLPLDDSAVAFLRSREGADGIIRSEPLPAGQEVRITRGPLQGLVAVVEQRLTARQRVRVLLDILQRQTRVELPEKWVRQA
jgi:transcription antitermination factor NusG